MGDRSDSCECSPVILEMLFFVLGQRESNLFLKALKILIYFQYLILSCTKIFIAEEANTDLVFEIRGSWV